MDEFQRRGMKFPLNIETRHKRSQFFTLMDTGAIRSCINYNTFHKLNVQLTQREVPRVMGADGNDLGSMGTVELTLSIGANKVAQEFIVCRELRRNIILGVDYHIGLTRESRAKSAFVVPMGKWQFKHTPFGLSQAPAYFQLLIDKVLMGCSSFAIGYLDDIIIFSKTKEEHLEHLEEIFVRLRKFGLKMKCENCKKHIQYLGHLVSEKGFEPLPEKLESICKMPAPRTAKEVKQFLGLIGYYRKFVPHFVDISRPLTKLTCHSVTFEWTDQCAKAFNHLCELLMEYPILRYPNPTQGYILYTDASGIGWSGVLTQEHLNEKGKAKNHPTCYVSGQFRGSQLNWAALTKEAYAIYMSVRRLSFYITDVEVTIRSDHLPLKKFLNKQTVNSKVNNWAVELEQFRLHLEWIPGSRNLLADNLSCLLDVVPDAQKSKEPDDQEFSSYCFKELEPAKVLRTISTEVIELSDSSEDSKCSQEL